MKNYTQPLPLVVMCDTGHVLQHGVNKGQNFITRVGPARDLEEARELIRRDRRAMGETFGGLIEAPDVSKRVYGVFQSLGWEEVTDQI